LQTAMISAATAAFVTLAIEYAAKPWLEVRKARILDEARAYREIQADIKQFHILFASAKNLEVIEHMPERTELDLGEARDVLRDIQKQFAFVHARKLGGDVGIVLPLVLGRLDASCALGLLGIKKQLPPKTVVGLMTNEDEYDNALTAVSDYLLTPKTKPIGR